MNLVLKSLSSELQSTSRSSLIQLQRLPTFLRLECSSPTLPFYIFGEASCAYRMNFLRSDVFKAFPELGLDFVDYNLDLLPLKYL